MQSALSDVDSCKDVPFAVKVDTFRTPCPSDPQNRQNLTNFGLDLQNFRLILRLILGSQE